LTQNLADELELAIAVLHLPPGTGKWNKVEHRLFSFISRNWRARPLTDYRTVVERRDHLDDGPHRSLRTR
jgi:hypothetical protein